MRSGACAALLVALAAPALAGPRRVLVLPLDGTGDATARAKLNQAVQKLARDAADGAVVTVGDATFDETAAAVGCEPAAPKCAIAVRTTLGVDELVYGTATSDPAGATTVVIHRSSAANNPPSEATVMLAAGSDAPESALGPLFGRAVVAPDPAPLPLPSPPPPRDHTRRNIGIATVGGGGVFFVIGLAMWASVSSKQDEIDRAPTQTVDQLRALQALEDRAQTIAIVGDAMVLGGLALGGLGAWLLYKDRQERAVVVAPVVTPAGPAVTIGGRW